MTLRRAVIHSDKPGIAAYLPEGYSVIDVRDGKTYIEGIDRHGWTLDGYVIPRLGSGLFACEEITLDNARVGDGVTYQLHTDCKAGTIIARTAKTITMQRDKATLLNGFDSDAEDKLQLSAGGFAGHTSGNQRYEYTRDENGAIYKFTRREVRNKRTGKVSVVWKRTGSRTRSPGSTLSLGRNEFFDYNY